MLFRDIRTKRRRFEKVILGGVLFFVLVSRFCPADEVAGFDSGAVVESQWAVTLYNGVYTDRTVGETIFNITGDLEKKYLHGLGFSRGINRFREHFSLEFEGIFVKHHGTHKEGRQDYEEYITVLLLRYDNFPWNDHVHTSLAVGEGFSLTSRIPEREVQIRGNSQRLLNYMAYELAFTAPRYPRYSLVYRIHHRSGVFGLFGGVKGASDFYVLGLRYRF